MCLPVVGAIVSGIGSVIGLAGQMAQAKAQEQLNKRQAQIETATGSYEAQRTTEQVQRTLGAQRAGNVANGVALSGTTADAIEESAREGALDVAAIRWNSGLKADNLRYEAKIDKMNAGIAGAAMPFAFLSPVIGGLAKIESSFS